MQPLHPPCDTVVVQSRRGLFSGINTKFRLILNTVFSRIWRMVSTLTTSSFWKQVSSLSFLLPSESSRASTPRWVSSWVLWLAPSAVCLKSASWFSAFSSELFAVPPRVLLSPESLVCEPQRPLFSSFVSVPHWMSFFWVSFVFKRSQKKISHHLFLSLFIVRNDLSKIVT